MEVVRQLGPLKNRLGDSHRHHRMKSILTFLCLVSFLTAQEVKLPPKEQFHLFLLVGQSNMAGRGVVEEQDAASSRAHAEQGRPVGAGGGSDAL
jgi:hypothetical protein